MYHSDHPGHQMPSFVRLCHGRIEPTLLYQHIAFLELAEIVHFTVEYYEEHISHFEWVVLIATVAWHFKAILVVGPVITDHRHVPGEKSS